jgi:hypothetical protein
MNTFTYGIIPYVDYLGVLFYITLYCQVAPLS